MRVSLVQYAPVWEDRGASRAKLVSLLAGLSTDWIVLPEMALSGFTMERSASTWDETDHAFFSALARSRSCIVTVGAAKEGHNTALVFGSDGAVVSAYEKRHLFSFSGEDGHYVAGTRRA
ncbi:MAG: nitrilase-related carbon-nitrogen hydrolase, partial [Spirochaetota bacterium]